METTTVKTYSRWQSAQCENDKHGKCQQSALYPCECECHDAPAPAPRIEPRSEFRSPADSPSAIERAPRIEVEAERPISNEAMTAAKAVLADG